MTRKAKLRLIKPDPTDIFDDLDKLKADSTVTAEPRSRYIGAPLTFVNEVCRLTEGRAALVVALCIYRRTVVCKSQTVTLPGGELTKLGIDRCHKRRALAKLQSAGLIEVKNAVGRTAKITLLWKGG